MKNKIESIQQFSFILGLVLLLSSCEKEYENHCEFEGDEGKICKELRYESEVLVETVSYEYGSHGLVSFKLHENKSGKNIGHVAYNYDDQNMLISEVFKNPDQEILIKNTKVYDASQLLKSSTSEVFGLKKVTDFTYSSKLLIQEKIYLDEQLQYNKVYQYFDNDSLSFDVLIFDSDSVLTSVNQHRRYDVSTARIESYDQYGDLFGYKVLLSDSEGQLIEKREYDAFGTLLHQEEYRYGQWGVEEYNFLSNSSSNRKIKYLRFN